MGLFVGDFRFLISAKSLGLGGGAACTIGRQPLFLSEQTMHRIAAEYDQRLCSLQRGQAIYLTDQVLRALGFEQVDVLDISDYEGANLIHDLNVHVSRELEDRFDLIVDGGTLEHVFNFPVAIENVMRMLRVGGEILLTSPANNYCGHGFYQISPELFFRVFSPANGFEIVRIYMQSGGQYYHIIDPVDVHSRVELVSPKMALLMVHARKTGRVPEPLKIPQQSDYVTIWEQNSADTQIVKRDGRVKSFVRARLSGENVAKISSLLFQLRLKRDEWLLKKRARLTNRTLYAPVTKWDMMTRDAFNR